MDCLIFGGDQSTSIDDVAESRLWLLAAKCLESFAPEVPKRAQASAEACTSVIRPATLYKA
jgi:hypothetical protein